MTRYTPTFYLNNIISNVIDTYRVVPVKVTSISLKVMLMELYFTATEYHLPYGITCHPTQVTTPALTLAIQAGIRFTYPGGMGSWVDLDDWLHAEWDSLPAHDGHPFKY